MIRLPVLIDMATFAGLVGIVFFIDVSIVDVLVTIRALTPNFSEFPFGRFFFMAGNTWGGNMPALERELGQFVIGNGE